MFREIVLKFIVVFMCMITIACANKDNVHSLSGHGLLDQHDLKVILGQIERETGELISEYDLFKDKAFIDIWVNPELYSQEVLVFIADPKNSELQKRIAALAMHNLELYDFILYSRAILDLREKRIVSEDLFWTAVFATANWDTKISDNYQNEEVRALLAELQAASSISDKSKKQIARIMSGERKAQTDDMRATTQIDSDHYEKYKRKTKNRTGVGFF